MWPQWRTLCVSAGLEHISDTYDMLPMCLSAPRSEGGSVPGIDGVPRPGAVVEYQTGHR